MSENGISGMKERIRSKNAKKVTPVAEAIVAVEGETTVPPTDSAINTKLEQTIITFYDVKSSADKYKKESDELNKEIKRELRVGVEAGQSVELVVGDLSAVFQVQERTSMNSEKLLQRLRDLGLTQAIKTIEAPDENVLEDLIYRGELDAGLISDCNESSLVEVLKVTKVKAKKEKK